MRCCNWSRTAASKERMLRAMVAESGITLATVPACSVPTVTTAICRGSTLRATTLCSAITMLPAMSTGSTVKCGRAAWPPRPWMVMCAVSLAAMKGPLPKPKLPVVRPGLLCRPNMASHGKRSNNPSSIMRCAPLFWPASSAGWNTTCTVPLKLRWRASCCAAPSSMVVWPS